MSAKIILITGANRGIGFSILQSLATRFPKSTYLLGTRALSNGEPAIKQLRDLGITAPIEPLELDVTNDDSIAAAASSVRARYGRLDVLVNNAGVATMTNAETPPTEARAVFARTMDMNVASVLNTISAFLPLLKAAKDGIEANGKPVVINVSSSRGSIGRSAAGGMPPTLSMSYGASKAALNSVTVEMSRAEDGVAWYAICPGHCKTAFNGYRGARDPLEGANVVAELVAREGRVEMGFYETKEDSLELNKVPW